MEIEYLNKLIDIAGQDLGIDLKKNTSILPSPGIGKTNGK